MPVPLSQSWTVASYVLGKKLRGIKRYALVLMLEPLFRCNLACSGCGKIQYPADILRKHLSVEECLRAADECGAPMVAIPGGEPLLHPQIDEIVAGLVKRKKYVYLCTNALLMEKHLHRFKPTKYFSFSVHMDGLREEHDHAVCREGTFDIAISAIRKALQAGFRVTTNSTLFDNANPQRMRAFFDEMMNLGVEGLMLSPGYQYEKAPDQEHFLQRNRTIDLFTRMLSGPKKAWKFNLSPLFVQFLQGKYDLECTPWGSPTYNLFGWQKPCYLLQEGYAKSFQELLDTTEWDNYGRASGNPKCANCMMHCGYEPTAVSAAFGSLRGLWTTARLFLFGDGSKPIPESAPHPSLQPAAGQSGFGLLPILGDVSASARADGTSNLTTANTAASSGMEATTLNGRVTELRPHFSAQGHSTSSDSDESETADISSSIVAAGSSAVSSVGK